MRKHLKLLYQFTNKNKLVIFGYRYYNNVHTCNFTVWYFYYQSFTKKTRIVKFHLPVTNLTNSSNLKKETSSEVNFRYTANTTGQVSPHSLPKIKQNCRNVPESWLSWPKFVLCGFVDLSPVPYSNVSVLFGTQLNRLSGTTVHMIRAKCVTVWNSVALDFWTQTSKWFLGWTFTLYVRFVV